jgi:hypothetical protein
MISILLAVAAVALYVLPLIVPKPPPPDDIALPPLGPVKPVPAAGASFPSAVSSLDAVVRYLVAGDRYGAAQAAAARVLRSAMVDAANPEPPVQEWAVAAATTIASSVTPAAPPASEAAR